MSANNDPFLDAAMRGWIVNFSKDNFWRVEQWYEFEDLVQDGYMCYAKCRQYYNHISNLRHPGQSERRQFMRLVQTTFTNHIHKLANRRTRGQELIFSQYMDDEVVGLEAVLPALPEEATMRCLLASAPREIVDLVALLAKEGVDAVKFVRSNLRWREDGRRLRKYRRRLRETTNEHYCRRLGLDARTVDLLGMLKSHLGLT